MSYTLRYLPINFNVMVVGCGGTGGFVAEGLCRLLGPEHLICLVDHDRVEDRNLIRQNFFPGEVGKFKAAALAERLSKQYRREVNYTVIPIEQLSIDYRSELVIGCVDNPSARARLQIAGKYTMGGYFTYCNNGEGGWYIDSGNGEHSGQVMIGNSFVKGMCRSFNKNNDVCSRLPLPQLQQPALLAPESAPLPSLDCAEAVRRQEQSPVINRVMADLVLTFVHKLTTGTLGWMAAYVDLEAGSMTAVDATPEAVTRITGYTIKQLEYRPRKAK